MPDTLTRLLDGLNVPLRDGINPIRRGIEREALRVDANGNIAQTAHPEALGHKLTHPWITTDYAEALMELVTPVCDSVPDVLAFLTDLHHHVLTHLPEGERLWPASMPARLPNGSDSVQIADFGASHSGQLKHVYRRGLRHRYGSVMQSIAGIHYNFSLTPELWRVLQTLEHAEHQSLDQYRTERYFHLIRQFRRNSWLLLYLFGSSVAVDDTFFADRPVPDSLVRHGQHTLLAPHATSLRMSDMGYQNRVQRQLRVCFNRLDSYIRTLKRGIETPWPPYQEMGVVNDRGEWQQISDHVLQIENEYYCDVRPKRVAQRGQTQLQALHDSGVEYIEVRCLDIDPQLPLGIDETQIRFLDTFLMWCLLSPGDWISEEECQHLDDNRASVAVGGREAERTLSIEGRKVTLAQQATLLFDQLAAVADCLDLREEGEPHQRALATLRRRLDAPSLTASGQAASALAQGGELTTVAMQWAERHASTLLAQPLREGMAQRLEEKRAQSFADERALVAQDRGQFEDYLECYLASARHIA